MAGLLVSWYVGLVLMVTTALPFFVLVAVAVVTLAAAVLLSLPRRRPHQGLNRRSHRPA